MTRTATVIAINLIVFGMLAEVVGLLLHFVETGRIFYLHRPVYESIGEAPADRLTADVLNPYFGPSHQPGLPFEIPPELRAAGQERPHLTTNNFGFVSPYDFPIARSGDQFIIGIFGGSVGVWFCQVGVPHLLAELQQHSFFKARTLVPLCMAHEGYKQPQQLIVLAYFLSIGQSFDLVINIDGFNEVALSPLNDLQHLDISMPSATHLLPMIDLIDTGTLTPPKLQSLTAIAGYRKRLNGVAATLEWNPSAAVNAVLSRYRIWLMGRFNEELRVFDGLPAARQRSSLIGAIPPTEERPGAVLFEDIARNWAQASLLMRTLLTAQGTPYVHVLQPNQYHTSRSFTDEESAVARNADSPFKPGVEQGYPALLAGAATHGLGTRSGFFDGTDMFDLEPAPVYIDDCCHYTRVGNLRLADFVARAVLRVPGRWNSPAAE